MRLRFALGVLALSLASFGVAQDTVQLVHDLPQLHVGTLNELDNRYLVLRRPGEGEQAKLFPRDSVALTRFADGRLYLYSGGKPVRVSRSEIAPATELSVRPGFFSDSFYDGGVEIPRAAFDFKLLPTPRQRKDFQRARALKGLASVLAIPAGVMTGLLTAVALSPDYTIKPQFALVTCLVLGTTLAINATGNTKQRYALAKVNAGL